MFARGVIDHLKCAARGMRDEDPPGVWIERGVVEGAARSVGYLDDAEAFQGHDDLTSLRREQASSLMD
jgi:hypothetical protein